MRVDEALVVALVEADRRLVEHVEHADQPAPDLRREPDPLRLAAGQGRRRPVEAEVVEADVEQEPQPLVDLLLDPLGDHAVALGELERPEELRRLADRQLADLVDVLPADGDRERRRPQACATARLARHLAHVALDLLAGAVALGLGVASLEPRHDAFELRRVRALAAVAVAVRHLHRRSCRCRRARPASPSSSASSTACRWRSRTRRRRSRAPARSSGCGTPTTARSRRRARLRSSSGTRSSGSTSKRVPSPSQRSHAPYGELNEKLRGASSSNDTPQCVHARCSENVSVSRSPSDRRRAGTISTSATPSARRSAVSSESVRRRSMPGRRTSRSTTTSMVWFSYRASRSLVAAPSSHQLAVDAGAGEALRRELLQHPLVLALAAPHDRRQHLEARALRRVAARGRRSAAASGG